MSYGSGFNKLEVMSDDGKLFINVKTRTPAFKNLNSSQKKYIWTRNKNSNCSNMAACSRTLARNFSKRI